MGTSDQSSDRSDAGFASTGRYSDQQRAHRRIVPGRTVCGNGALLRAFRGEGASDLVIKEYPLDDMIRKAIRKYAGQLIRRKLRVIYEGTDICVLTDEKWLVFIIEQLLSNAVKYTVSGNVTITVDREKSSLVSAIRESVFHLKIFPVFLKRLYRI